MYIVQVKKKTPAPKNWRPTIEDDKLLKELQKKLGVSETDILRLGLRALATKEGLAA